MYNTNWAQEKTTLNQLQCNLKPEFEVRRYSVMKDSYTCIPGVRGQSTEPNSLLDS